MYAQRYVPHFPAAGEVVIFNRSWYNRTGVERVMGFCTEEQVERFLQVAPQFEKMMIESGIILIKYWLEVSPEEQTRRLEARIEDGRKIWKLSPMDLQYCSFQAVPHRRAWQPYLRISRTRHGFQDWRISVIASAIPTIWTRWPARVWNPQGENKRV